MATLKDPITSTEQRVEAAHKAARVSIYPQQVVGEYRYSGFTGLLPAALAANAEIMQFRWGAATHLCILKFLKVRFSVITGFTAAQELGFDAVTSVTWTANGTGGTSIAPGANNLKKRQAYEDSKVADFRIATTAALGVGSKSITSQSFLAGMGKTLAAAATVQDAAFEDMVDFTQSGDAPYVFAQNEGFSVRNSILLGAGGTVRAAIQVAWAEVLATDYPSFA